MKILIILAALPLALFVVILSALVFFFVLSTLPKPVAVVAFFGLIIFGIWCVVKFWRRRSGPVSELSLTGSTSSKGGLL